MLKAFTFHKLAINDKSKSQHVNYSNSKYRQMVDIHIIRSLDVTLIYRGISILISKNAIKKNTTTIYRNIDNILMPLIVDII